LALPLLVGEEAVVKDACFDLDVLQVDAVQVRIMEVAVLEEDVDELAVDQIQAVDSAVLEAYTEVFSRDREGARLLIVLGAPGDVLLGPRLSLGSWQTV
jgi:hypothetical protein